MNITPLTGGYYALTEQRPTGFGADVWIGELRNPTGKPIRATINPSSEPRGQHYCYPITTGPTEAGVIAALQRRAHQLTAQESA